MPVSPNDVASALAEQSWTFAKTMPDNPHEYIDRKHWVGEIAFDAVVTHIREHGYKLPFKGRDYICLDVGRHRYWTMGDTLSNTWILNRAVNRQR